MTTYIHDEMIKNYITLILYVLKDIKIIELRRVIWEKILIDDESEEDILNQEWYEIELHDLYSEIERHELSDLDSE